MEPIGGRLFVCMEDDVSELILAGNLCRQNGYLKAATILGKEGAREIRAKRKPRKRMIPVRLGNGSPGWIEKGRLNEAIEYGD
jgi:hypothetical protein